MLLQKMFWLFLMSSNAFEQNETLFNLISRYLNKERSKFCLFVLCWTDKERINLQKYVHMNGNTRTMFYYDEKNLLDILNNDQITIILDFDCPNAMAILRENDDMKFRFSYNWLIIMKNVLKKTETRNLLSDVKLRLDSKFRIAVPESQYNIYRIYELFAPGIGADIKIHELDLENCLSFYEIRKNLEGVLIRTGNRDNYSSTYEEDYLGVLRIKDRAEFQMFNFQLFLLLKEVHHFHFNTTTRNVWFGNSTSGIDGGLSQLLHERKIDFSTSGGYLGPARIDYHDFLSPLYKFRSAFIFVNPGKSKPGLEILKPFSIDTWYASVVGTITIGISIYLTYKLEYKSHSKYSFCTSMLMTLSVISQQGSSITPLKVAGRIIFLTLLIMSMMLYNYYTSSLVSSLLSNVPEPIKTIKELYESDLKVALEPQPYAFTYLLQQKDDRYINLLNRTKIYENGVPNTMLPIEGIEKVKLGTYAYLTELATAFSCLADSDQEVICDLAYIIFIPYGDVGLVAQKRSQYTELFHITKILTSGIYQRNKEFWLSKRPKCMLNSRVKAVGAGELFLVYLIITGGMITSLIIFLIELSLHNYC